MKVDIEDTLTASNLDIPFKEYPYRWVSTGIYLLSAFVGSMMVQTCTPIVEELSEAYDVSTTLIKLTALIFMVTHPPFTILGNWLVESKGLKFSLNFGSILIIIGLGVRMLVNYNFYWMILGSVLCSAGNVFVLNTPAKVASNWWFSKNRMAVTTACTFASMISGAASTGIPVILFDKNDAKNSFFRIVMIQEVFIGIVFLLNILLFREKPPTPPSYSSSQPRKPFLTAMPALIRNPEYVKLFFAVICVMGGLNSFFVNIESWMKPFGFRSQDVSIMSISSTFLGILGSVISVLYVRKSKKYKMAIAAYSTMGFLGMAGLTAGLYSEKLAVITAVVGFASFGLYPIIATAIELGCELVYPIGEATAAGTMLAGGQITSFFVGILTSQYVVDGQSKERSLLYGAITCSFLLVTFTLNLLIKVELKRDLQDIKNEADDATQI